MRRKISIRGETARRTLMGFSEVVPSGRASSEARAV